MWLFHRRKCWGWAGRGSDATPVWWLAFRVNLHPKHIFYPGVKRAACFLLTGFLLPSTVELAFFILLYSVQPFWASHGILVQISHSGLPKSSSELYALFLPPRRSLRFTRCSSPPFYAMSIVLRNTDGIASTCVPRTATGSPIPSRQLLLGLLVIAPVGS